MAVKRIKQNSEYALNGAMEVAVMCQLGDDVQNLVRFVGWYMKEGDLHIVTKYYEGGTLIHYLQDLGRSSEPVDITTLLKFNRFVKEIAAGMCKLEEEKILHRDLAARNILLSENKSHIKVRCWLMWLWADKPTLLQIKAKVICRSLK